MNSFLKFMKLSASHSTIAATIVFTLRDQTWSGAADALWSSSGNWTSAVPGSGDIAIFDAASLANPATTLGADQIVLGIKVLDPAAGISIAAGNSLTVGPPGWISRLPPFVWNGMAPGFR